MKINKKSLFKKVIVSLGFVVVPFFIMLLVLTVAVQLSNHQETVLIVGNSLEGFGDYFVLLRLGIITFIITFWKEIVRYYGKSKGLNLKQIYFLKKLYPLIVVFILIVEVFGYFI